MADLFFLLAELAVDVYMLVSALYLTPTANPYERLVLVLLALLLVRTSSATSRRSR